MHPERQIDLAGRKIGISVILLAAFALTLPIFLFGMPLGSDMPQHIQFASTFYDSLQAGELVPSFSSTTNHGFGDVGVRFYPPLTYYVLAVLRMLTGNWHDAAVIAFAMWFFAGGLGIYLWSREYFSDAASLAAALAYTVAPYHVNELYNASLFAEFAAAGILPFCFLFVSRVCTTAGLANILGLAAAYALLILTHLPTAIIGSAGLLVYAFASLPREGRSRALAALSSSVTISLILSAFYWVKMAAELPFVNHTATEFVERAYDFRLNFIASYLYLPAESYGDGLQWFGDMLAVTAACLFISGALFYLFGASRGPLSNAAGPAFVFLLAVFFATPMSAPVWENFSLLQKIQFPYRWMVLVNLAGSFFVAAGFGVVISAFSSKSRPLALLAAGLALVGVAFTAAQVVRPALYLPKAEVEAYVTGLSDDVSYKCWWSMWARDAAFTNEEPVSSANASSITSWSKYEKRFTLAAVHPSSVRLAVFYYPHWKAEANGRPVAVSADENGAAVVQLPEGPADVRVFFEEPIYARFAGIISALSWLAFLGLMLFFSVRKFGEYVYRNSDRKPV